MKLSSKSRYALACLTCMAEVYEAQNAVTLSALARRLRLSKIYLEQVFTLLRNAGLVLSIKGAQGGYLLSRTPEAITVFDILSAIETSLFSANVSTASDTAVEIEQALVRQVYEPLDQAIKSALTGVTLADLLNDAQAQQTQPMYYL